MNGTPARARIPAKSGSGSAASGVPANGHSLEEALMFLLTMGRELQRSDPAKSLDCLNRAARLARTLGLVAAEVEALVLVGTLELQTGRLSSAEEPLVRALELARARFQDAAASPRSDDAIAAEEDPDPAREHNSSAAILLASSLNAMGLLRTRQGQDGGVHLRESLSRTRELPAAGPAALVRAEALEHLGLSYAHKGGVDQALRYYEEALELRRAGGDRRGIARDLNQLGNLRHRTGQYQAAVEFYRESLHELRTLDEVRAAAATANNLASTLFRLGDMEEARAMFEECRESFQRLGESGRVADVLSNLGLLAQAQGRLDEAENRCTESLRLRTELGDAAGQSNSLTNLSHLHVARGAFEEAMALADQSAELMRKAGLEGTLASALVCKGLSLLGMGAYDAAGAVAREASQAAEEARAADQKCEVLLLLAQLELQQGRSDEALSSAREAARLAEEIEDPELTASACRCLGAITRELGRLDEAMQHLARAERLLRGWDHSFERARVLFEEGLLQARAGAQEGAAERLRRAEREFAHLRNHRYRVLALLQLASLCHDSDPVQSERIRAQARALAEEHGCLDLVSDVAEGTAAPGDAGYPARTGLDRDGLGVERLAECARALSDSGLPRPATLASLLDPVFRSLGVLAMAGTTAAGESWDEEKVPDLDATLSFEGGSACRWAARHDEKDGRYFVREATDGGGPITFRALTSRSKETPGPDPAAQRPAPEDPLARADVLTLPLGTDAEPWGRMRLERSEPPFRASERAFAAAVASILCLALRGEFEAADVLEGPGPEPSMEGDRFEFLVGTSPPMKEVYRLIEQVARTEFSVLILGESGTGKELVARSVHARSRRRERPFVAINCPSIPKDLMESELFGHERGAFTGAITSKPGRIELAQGGTLFLDEVGDMPLSTQAKLLRFLQEREFERVGGSRSLKVDVRILSATSRDLNEAMERGEFRSDLFYRLNVLPVRMPPLRERPGDIPLLVAHILRLLPPPPSGRARRISPAALDRLMEHDWPGNVRELRNTIEYMMTLCPGDALEARHLPPALRGKRPANPGSSGYAEVEAGEFSKINRGLRAGETLQSRLVQVEAAIIRACLEAADWNQSAAARRLGITESMVRNRMKQYGIERGTTT